VVAAGIASRCEIQIAYAIGVAKPVSLAVNTFGTSSVSEEKISLALGNLFDLRPAAIIERFGLRRPIYCDLAAYGHMGREDLKTPWEERDLAPLLAEALL
jgi:S-adenosylmethionine synthetase